MKITNAVLVMFAATAMAVAQSPATPSQAAKTVRRASAEVAVIPTAPAVPMPKETPSSRRDPFVSPIVRATTTSGSPCQGGGKKCLAPDQVVLRGIVDTADGKIAVVESTGRKISYFLRENDPVFNGYVVKITEDSVVFREKTQDNLGRAGTREITRKIAPA
jgi:Tfp pilus assembly protein PilP